MKALRALCFVALLAAPARAEDLYLNASSESALQTALATMNLWSSTGGYVLSGVGFGLTFLPGGAWNVPLVKKTASTWVNPCAVGCVQPAPKTVFVAPAAVGSPTMTAVDPSDTDYTQQTTTQAINGQSVTVPATHAVSGFTVLLRWLLDPSLISSAVKALQITTPNNPPVVYL